MEIICFIIFIFSAAMAAGSIMLLSHLIEETHLPFLRSLLYHSIFISAFGFYGIWGQFIIAFFAGNRLDPDIFSAVSVISLLLGLPFLVFGWMMLIRSGIEAAGHKAKNSFSLVFLFANFGILTAIGISVRNMDFTEALPLFKYYYASAAVLFSFATAFIMMRGHTASPARNERLSLSAIAICSAVAQSIVLLLFPHSVWIMLVFVFLLFAGLTLIPLYLRYGAELKICSPVNKPDLPSGVEEFIKKHDISPREAEIITEICNGLSNQEIADKLFISLQTVKDHTSRIYSKVNVRNRMQLMAIVRDMKH